jgi:hypothetical protein
MTKRGQLTAFIVVGIVLVASVILVMYLRGQFFFGPVTPDNLANRMVPISEHITNCIKDLSPEEIERMGLQGGHLKTPKDTFRKQNDIPISYLCYNVEGRPQCYNRVLLISEMEEELNEAIRNKLTTCINVKSFERGFDVTTGALNVDTEIGRGNVLVSVNYPVILKKGDVIVNEENFDVNFNYPLGKLYDVTQDIINVEAEFGEFDQMSYMLVKRGQYIIEKKKPYPDKLYILKTKDSPYIFQFMIQGEPN